METNIQQIKDTSESFEDILKNRNIELFKEFILKQSAPIKVWFRINDLQWKTGMIIDGFYEGLLQVKEEEEGKIYIVSWNEIEII